VDVFDIDFTDVNKQGVFMRFRPVLVHFCLILAGFLLLLAYKLCRNETIPVLAEVTRLPVESA